MGCLYYHTGWSGRASRKMTFEPIPERVTETCEQWWNNVLDRGNSKYKGPEVGMDCYIQETIRKQVWLEQCE